MNRVRSVRSFVELYQRLVLKLQSSGSPLGAQLEMLKNSEKGVFVRRDDGDAVRGALAALDRIAFYGHVVRIWSALDLDEQRILILKNTVRRNFDMREGWKVDAFVLHREVRLTDVVEGDGLSVVGFVRDENDELTDFVKVEEMVPRCWGDEDIAELLNLTVRVVQRRTWTGGRKILNHALFAQLDADE